MKARAVIENRNWLLVVVCFAILQGMGTTSAQENLSPISVIQPPGSLEQAPLEDRDESPVEPAEMRSSSEQPRFTDADPAIIDRSDDGCDSLGNHRCELDSWCLADTSSRPLVTASMIVNQYYTDNVFYSRPFWNQLRRDDWVTVYLPSLNYRFENSRREINLGGSAELGRYVLVKL